MFNNSNFNVDTFNDDSLSTVGRILLYIEKDVVLNVGVPEQILLNIEKEITRDNLAQIILKIEKRITSPTPTDVDFFTRFGWEPIVLLDGLEVEADELCGTITVNKTINDNHTAQFSLIIRPGTYSLYNYQGASVQIYYKNNNGIYILFSGVVDVPSVNVLQERLTLSCIADRRVLLENIGGIVPYLGHYSDVVLSNTDDVYTAINERLSTIPFDLDFDSSNNYTLNSWTPKASADFIFSAGTIYRRDPKISIQSSGKIVNSITINMQYLYQRLHHRQFVYTWAHPYAPAGNGVGGICPFLQDAPTMPTRESIHTAAKGTGWALKEDTFSYGKQFLSGSYQCSGVWVQWSTIQSGNFNGLVYNENGTPALDSNGNQISRSVQTVIADNTNVYTMNASWLASKRFNQNMTESYNITIDAPSSQAIYGVLGSSENYSYTDPNPHAEWSQYQSWQSAPTGVQLYYDTNGSSYIINAADYRTNFANAFIVALNKAKTTILAAHRDSRINFQCPITPAMELQHTCSLTGKWMRGSGKCTTIVHSMTVAGQDGGNAGEAYTDVTLSAYRSTYAVYDTPLSTPAVPTDNYVPVQPGIGLGSHIGVDPSSPGSENWTGYVGNKQVLEQVINYNGVGSAYNRTKTKYQESFIVNSPAITTLTADKTLTSAVSYSVNIPIDNITYISYRGKYNE